MSVYQTKEFARFARKDKLSAKALLKAAANVAAGHFDADLGGGVFKQRVARSGQASLEDFVQSSTSKPDGIQSSSTALPRANVRTSPRRS